MLGKEELDRYRAMSPTERWLEVRSLMQAEWEFLSRLPGEERRRKIELILRRRNEEKERLARALGKMS